MSDTPKQPADKRTLDEAFAGYGPLVIASSLCIGPDRLPVRFMYRGAPKHDHDTGWTFFSGHESPEFNGDARNFSPIPLHRFVEIDASLGPVTESPVGTVWERTPTSETWTQVFDWEIPD